MSRKKNFCNVYSTTNTSMFDSRRAKGYECLDLLVYKSSNIAAFLTRSCSGFSPTVHAGDLRNTNRQETDLHITDLTVEFTRLQAIRHKFTSKLYLCTLILPVQMHHGCLYRTTDMNRWLSPSQKSTKISRWAHCWLILEVINNPESKTCMLSQQRQRHKRTNQPVGLAEMIAMDSDRSHSGGSRSSYVKLADVSSQQHC